MAKEVSVPDQIAIVSLEAWKHAWDKSYKPELLSHPMFSPEYDSIWQAAWRKYDELLSSQLHNSEAALPWQQSVEKYRATKNEARTTLYQDTEPANPAHLPLSIHCDRFRGTVTQGRVLHWKATLANWSNFVSLYEADQVRTDGGRERSFCQSLSSTQLSSYKILSDWWNSNYGSKQAVDAVRVFLARKRESSKPSPNMESPSLLKDILAASSYYHRVCFSLFLLEFNPRLWEPFMPWVSQGRLNKARFFASCLALIQYLTRRSFSLSSVESTATCPRVVSLATSEPIASSSANGPRWLWSTADERTVTVSQLTRCPPYICISHTWGRWRKTSAVMVRGVEDWLVPENELYDVQELPHKLKQLNFPYLWIDLFCIPQDDSPSADAEIARQSSIFRGATGAIAWLHDVDSWNHVRDSIKWLCGKYLQRFESGPPDYKAPIGTGSQSLSEGETHIGLIHVKHHTSPVDTSLQGQPTTTPRPRLEPSVWFSSLWTLQEAVLCPDMMLYSENWHRLEDETGAPLSLISIATFLHMAFWQSGELFNIRSHPMNPFRDILDNKASGSEELENEIPRAVEHLRVFLEKTRLDNLLLTSSRVSVLFNANTRMCTGSRAPAIMSALSLTDWYEELLRIDMGKQGLEKDLVLGIYPLAFVQEAMRKIGAPFFETAFHVSHERSQARLKNRVRTGSMLPFTRANGWLSRKFGPPEVGRLSIVDHPSVCRWQVLQDGAVVMHDVAILFSTSCHFELKSEGSILWFEDGCQQDGYTDNFGQTLRCIAASRIIHAVALYQDGLIQNGVLLEQSPSSLDGEYGCTYLIRIGIYWITRSTISGDVLPVQQVDWTVL